jgi:hypothetical protein
MTLGRPCETQPLPFEGNNPVLEVGRWPRVGVVPRVVADIQFGLEPMVPLARRVRWTWRNANDGELKRGKVNIFAVIVRLPTIPCAQRPAGSGFNGS